MLLAGWVPEPAGGSPDSARKGLGSRVQGHPGRGELALATIILATTSRACTSMVQMVMIFVLSPGLRFPMSSVMSAFSWLICRGTGTFTVTRWRPPAAGRATQPSQFVRVYVQRQLYATQIMEDCEDTLTAASL